MKCYISSKTKYREYTRSHVSKPNVSRIYVLDICYRLDKMKMPRISLLTVITNTSINIMAM